MCQNQCGFIFIYITEPKIFDDFHGALTKQYVCQELKCSTSNPIFYWGRDHGAAEIDFIMQYKNGVVPIEVKSGKNTQAKSLKVYMEEYKPKIAVRTSLCNIAKFCTTTVLREIPLYMIGSFSRVCTTSS